jgi:hypothetical protein
LRLGLGRAVPVGTGIPRSARDYREFVDADHMSYPSYQILFLFAITFENRYIMSMEVELTHARVFIYVADM